MGYFPYQVNRSRPLPSAPFGEVLASLSDLPLLPPVTGVFALVVATQQQDDPGAMEVHEHAEEDPLPAASAPLLAREHLSDLVGVVAHPELVQPLTERLEPFGPGQFESPLGQDEPEGSVERDELGLGELLDPDRERLASVLGLVDLELPGSAAHRSVEFRSVADVVRRSSVASVSGDVDRSARLRVEDPAYDGGGGSVTFFECVAVDARR